jgi:frataxin-like iron-binding protein CyaY
MEPFFWNMMKRIWTSCQKNGYHFRISTNQNNGGSETATEKFIRNILSTGG